MSSSSTLKKNYIYYIKFNEYKIKLKRRVQCASNLYCICEWCRMDIFTSV